MTGLLKHQKRSEPDLFDRFDRMFDEWLTLRPFRGFVTGAGDAGGEPLMIPVDEYREDGAIVIKAELPGIDPEKDVDVSVTDGMLHISAERNEESETEQKGYVRKELRYGSFSRTLPLPEGVAEADIKATYEGGILEIRIPAPAPKPATKVPIATK
jgi:HSP20 family protein